jgi:SAM-dependent methyltransferase
MEPARTTDEKPSLETLVESGMVELESLHPGGLSLTAELAGACGISAGTRVLDVASGTGESACFLAAEYGADVTGLDQSEALLARARAKAAERGLAVTFQQGDAVALPFADASFDVAICECTLCLLDKAAVLGEMARVVRPGGRVGMHDLYWRPGAPDRLRARLEHYEDEVPETLEGWRALFTGAGLVDVTTQDRSALKDAWMSDTRRQIGVAGQLRLGAYALRRWGPIGLWRIFASERVFSDDRLGYTLVTGVRP